MAKGSRSQNSAQASLSPPQSQASGSAQSGSSSSGPRSHASAFPSIRDDKPSIQSSLLSPPSRYGAWLSRDVCSWNPPDAGLADAASSLTLYDSYPSSRPLPVPGAAPQSQSQPKPHAQLAALPSDSRPPSPAASVISFDSESRDSGVALDARSKASHVTSLSIPPSIGAAPAAQTTTQTTFQSPRLPCHAPIPTRRLSSLDSLCAKTRRHGQYYFSNDLMILNVDGCLFRVHRAFLERDSPYFKKLFAREVGRGQSDETAIELPQVTVSAFEALLWFIYNGANEPCSYPVEDWIAILSASTTLSFAKIRERALCELESATSCLDAVDRLVLADRYDVDRWRAPAYVELCMRERPLQESEATVLGVKVAAQLAEVRERVLLGMLQDVQRAVQAQAQAAWGDSPPTRKLGRDYRRVDELVHEVFWPNGVPLSYS